MRVCLVMPPNVKWVEPFLSAEKKPPAVQFGFPIGLGYLAAVLREDGHDVMLLDASFEDLSMEETMSEILLFKPDLVGISITTHFLRTAVKLADVLHDWGIKTVAGGVHATYDAKFLSEYFDYVIKGEGESALRKLCNKVECPPIKDLDELPYPARDLVDFNRYVHNYGSLKDCVDVVSSRGCTNRCAFCSSGHFFGKWRPRSPERVMAEIAYLKGTYSRIKSINFFDDNFTANKERVMVMCDLIHGNFNWSCLGRVDQIDKEMARAMGDAGCIRVHLGIESGSPAILARINKRITLPQARMAVKNLRDHGIETVSFFMVGHPGESKESLHSTYRFAKELRSTNTLFSVAQVFPGTALEKLQPQDNWLGYLYEPEVKRPSIYAHPCIPNFIPEGFTREDLKGYAKMLNLRLSIISVLRNPSLLFKRLFTSPMQIWNLITKLLEEK